MYTGLLTFGSQTAGDTVTTDTKLLPFAPEAQASQHHSQASASSTSTPLPPKSICLTQFHVLALVEERLSLIHI